MVFFFFLLSIVSLWTFSGPQSPCFSFVSRKLYQLSSITFSKSRLDVYVFLLMRLLSRQASMRRNFKFLNHSNAITFGGSSFISLSDFSSWSCFWLSCGEILTGQVLKTLKCLPNRFGCSWNEMPWSRQISASLQHKHLCSIICTPR